MANGVDEGFCPQGSLTDFCQRPDRRYAAGDTSGRLVRVLKHPATFMRRHAAGVADGL